MFNQFGKHRVFDM